MRPLGFPDVIRFTLPALLAAVCGHVASAQEIGELFEPLEQPWLSVNAPLDASGEEDRIETDRDSFTPSTKTAGEGRAIFEAAYSFLDNRSTDSTHSFPEIITRIGITERTELRLGWNYEIGGGGSVSGGDAGGLLEASGSREESQMLYGFKTQVSEQTGWIPESAWIVQGTTPTSGLETATDFQLGYVFGWEIMDLFTLDSSLRYVATQEEGDHFNQWAPSVVVKAPLADRWNVHAEYFGVFTENRGENVAPQYFSPGIHYLITPDVEVGVRVGWGLNEEAANSFANVGFGLRF
ncbi:MAG: transporter [Planctomycetaceae bacterium]|nr:transporter [Planctomycetaceae bacterium]